MKKNIMSLGILSVALTGFTVLSLSDVQAATVNPTNNTTQKTTTKKVVTPAKKVTTTKPTPKVITNYKDGTYTANGVYQSPATGELVVLKIKLSSDKVVEVTFGGVDKNSKNKGFIEKFNKGVNDKVIGKNIDSINLDVVNGSSLTPIGFMDALSKIKQQAKNKK